MRRMTRTVVTAVAVLLLAARPAAACDCDRPSIKEGIEHSDAVFVAKAADVKIDGDRRVVTLEVSKAWKGANDKRVTVWTAVEGSTCGYAFEAGEEYLVYARDDGKGGLETNICMRTCRISEAKEDLKALGAAERG